MVNMVLLAFATVLQLPVQVFNATSANGLLYMIEQPPVQSGTVSMVMNLVTRAVSGPLDIRGDHSDLYFALNMAEFNLAAAVFMI
jgi:pyruvate/2-oxoacid:ferredoxin oxidoreductase alpha subunit